jgi:RNA-directed DNA polymerase
MYTFYNPSSKRTAFELADIGIQFCALRKGKDLAKCLNIEKEVLKACLKTAVYKTFTIPKASGGERIIETPDEKLKTLQRALQDQLQAVYYHIRPKVVHGAIIAAAGEERPRTILSNARAHTGKKFFFHLDLKNFFHCISEAKVKVLFESKIFGFPPKLADLLCQIVCYRGRLPMGTSTSGIVANLCLLQLDATLQRIALQHKITYTRFIDDLTFSSKTKIPSKVMEEFCNAVEDEQLVINEEKIKLLTLDDQPEITGLILVGNQVDIKPSYIKQIEEDAKLYQKLMKNKEHHAKIFSPQVLQHFKQHINGQLSFLRFVKGKENLVYIRLVKRMRYMSNVAVHCT